MSGIWAQAPCRFWLDATYFQALTVPLNLTGQRGVSIMFGTSRNGMPIRVQLVSARLAESTLLHAASLFESVHAAHDLHPAL